MELFGLYWHIWSKLTIISSENLTEDLKFKESAIGRSEGQIGVDAEFVMVVL